MTTLAGGQSSAATLGRVVPPSEQQGRAPRGPAEQTAGTSRRSRATTRGRTLTELAVATKTNAELLAFVLDQEVARGHVVVSGGGYRATPQLVREYRGAFRHLTDMLENLQREEWKW